MRKLMATLLAAGLVAVLAGPALAEQPTARNVQAAVDSYLSTSSPSTSLGDASLVGGPGSAGYDAGFWIRGGDFLLRINLTLQARFESQDWDDPEPKFGGGGDLSGYSLPRATVKLSGEAPCHICYYVELEFGHQGRIVQSEVFFDSSFDNFPTNLPGSLHPADLLNVGASATSFPGNLGPIDQSYNFDNTREAWIEWCGCPSLKFRMGQIQTPTTRQMMTPAELQQFVDICLVSSVTAQFMPGYTSRNRDFGAMMHGSFGCNAELSYMAAVTNGDGGDSIRNVLDNRTDDNLAFSGRLNWAFLNAIGYEEGALRQSTCTWYGEAGVWAHYFADRRDQPHTVEGDFLTAGVDVALGYGGWSFTGAFTIGDYTKIAGLTEDVTSDAWLAQLGFLFPDTAWEVAARVDRFHIDRGSASSEGSALEFAFAVNYYLNGHGNKLTVDVSFLDASDDFTGVYDFYAGYGDFLQGESSAILLRFQWQLAL